MKSGIVRNGALAALATSSLAYGAASWVWVGSTGYYGDSGNWTCTGTCNAGGYPYSTDADVYIELVGTIFLNVDSQADDVVIVADSAFDPLVIAGYGGEYTLEAETITFTSEDDGIVDLTNGATIVTVDR